jgi:hypothetical protein
MRFMLAVGLAGLLASSTSFAQPPFPIPAGGRGEAVPRAAARAAIAVRFVGPVVQITSSQDVSNVVLEYDDYSRQRFENLKGRQVELRGTGPHMGKPVVRAWVKAGPNLSGEGSGYGQRFDRSSARESPPHSPTNRR